jgi:hypothetical protein
MQKLNRGTQITELCNPAATLFKKNFLTTRSPVRSPLTVWFDKY